MANVFLLGNGFDLHHELPTKYENFLHTIHFLRDHYSETMKTVGSVFGNKFFRDCDKQIPKSYELYKSAYDETPLDSDVIEELRKKAKENYWFNYLLSTFDEDRGWIDFEKEIAQVLKAFESMFEIKTTKSPSTGRVFIELEKLDDERYKYIIKKFNFFSKYTSTGRLEITDEYSIENPYGSKIFEVNKEKIIDDLYKNLEELAVMLKIYLTIFVEQALEQMVSQNIVKRNKLFENEGYVISFNYTNTYESIYLKRAAHIHGNTSDSIVLGVNPDGADYIENIDTSFIQFKKYYQRVVFGTDNDYIKVLEDLRYIKEHTPDENTLYVVGHSLDVTDKDIIVELFDTAVKITIMYHDRSAIGSYVKNLVSIYGKEEFDKLRYDKKLTFLPLEEL